MFNTTDLLNALGGAQPTQANRLLRLHTPLGANVLLAETLKGVEGISGATNGPTTAAAPDFTGFCLQVDALSTNAHIELKALIGQPVLLEIQTDTSRDDLRPLHGHVTGVVCVGSNAGLARYRLTIEPWLRFLGVGRDSAVFQDQNVLTIVQTVLADYQAGGAYQGAGTLEPQWRLDIADPSIYPVRSLTTQYQESDLAFIERLLAEEGLFYWFEHTGDPHAANLGQHTLVIADHNGAFQPGKRDTIRFSQSGTGVKDDTIDRWRTQAQWHTHGVELASWDYRTLDSRPVVAHATAGDATSATLPANMPQLLSQDTPGAYAYESAQQGQRLATNHLQALTVPGKTVELAGSVRHLCPGSTFTLTERDSAPGNTNDTSAQPHVVLRVIHHARNNLGADLKAHAKELTTAVELHGKLASSPLDTCASSYDFSSVLKSAAALKADTQGDLFYRNAALALPLAVPYRAADTDATGQLIHPKPSVQGSQTALVIGVPGKPLTTERDHRIKVQFAWQRGSASHSRLSHPTGDEGHSGAPAADDTGATTGTWVRVATPLAPQAGANWGSVALPRAGQEVLITFLGGDIDRPVVVGALYNGRGADNAQNNQVVSGGANATGNAPMWFPGDQGAQGKGGTTLPGHAHSAVLSGIKTQSMASSQSGTGAYNQLVFDDTPGLARVGLHTHAQGSGSGSGKHSGASELNLGALRQQTDNQLLSPTGYGLELKTHHSGALRAGSGMLISADGRPGNASGAASGQMDSEEAVNQLQAAHSLMTTLGDSAQAHKAMLPVLQGGEVKPKEQPIAKQLVHSVEVMQTKSSGTDAVNTTAALMGGGGNGSGGSSTNGGGAGNTTAYSEPLLAMSAPAGIALLTPQSASLNAGNTTSITAGHDINLMAQGHAGHSVKGGISFFTYGKATNGQKPNTETGIRLHAASGKVSSQSQSSNTKVTADKSITVASTTASVTVQAKEHVLLTAQGAYIKMSGGNIDVHAPGMVDLKGSSKSWTGGKGDRPAPLAFSSSSLVMADKFSSRMDVYDIFQQQAFKGVPYSAKLDDGRFVTGNLDVHGRSAQIYASNSQEMSLLAGESKAQWDLIVDYDDE